jgi:hypothetical protein
MQHTQLLGSTTVRKFDIPRLYQHVKSKVASYWSSVSIPVTLTFDVFKGEDGHHVIIVTERVVGNVAFSSCVDPGERGENVVFYRDAILAELEAGAEESGQAVYERYYGIVGDNVRYDQAALRHMESVHPKFVIDRCIFLTLALMIEAVSKVAEIRAIVQQTREIVNFVKSHNYAQAMLEKTCSPSMKARMLYPEHVFCFRDIDAAALHCESSNV